MNEKQRVLFELPFNKDILKFCEGHSIQDVSTKVGLSYKTVFNRIKDLEKNGMIKLEQMGNKQIIHIALGELNLELLNYNVIDKSFQANLSVENEKEVILLLEFYKNNRLSSDGALSEYMIEKKLQLKDIGIINVLQQLGFTRNRTEITKKGLKFLKEHKK